MENLQKTALHQLHIELQAKMVAFANYQMPLHYQQGIIHEHLHTRQNTGLFDVSHMGQILIKGKQVGELLEQLTPAKICTLKVGQQRYGVFTNTQGGVIDDFVITRFESEYMMIVNAAQKQGDFTYLQKSLKGRCQLEFLDLHALIAMQGPQAVRVLRKFAPECAQLSFMQACETSITGFPCRVFRSGYSGEDGFEISILATHVEQIVRTFLAQPDVAMVGLGARDTLRLEAGLCLYGQDLNAQITPVEAGLSWALRKQANNYPGADVIVKQIMSKPAKKRVGLKPHGKLPVRADTRLLNDNNQEVGVVSSGGFSPSLGRPIAMGYVDVAEAEAGKIVFARVRNRKVAITITSLPFITHRYYRNSL